MDAGHSPIAESQIQDVLGHPKKLVHSARFTGRPATQVFASDTYVLKLRTDFVFQYKDADKRALAALAEERSTGAYHPAKTWFVMDDGDTASIGNITPRLHPFHQESPELLARDPDEFLRRIGDLLRLYLQTAASIGERLDEGLSNFGWDTAGHVYYMDDDRYPWDDFTSLANILTVWLRQLGDIDTALAEKLGARLSDAVLNAFGTRLSLLVLLGQLQSTMTVSQREKDCLKALMAPLNQSAYKKAAAQAAEKATPKTKPAARKPIPEPVGKRPMAVIADIHANLPALETVLDDIARHEIEDFLILGDIVGYGPHPNECIERLQPLNAIVIQGNHDYAAATGDISRGFSKLASWAIEWTREVINPAHAEWLGSLSPVHRQDGWIAVHGAPMDKHYFYGYVYRMTFEANLEWLQEHKLRFGFHGHSHIQTSYVHRGRTSIEDRSKSLPMARLDQALICPGSVGQPRGGETSAEYAIFDPNAESMSFHSVPYAVDTTVADMARLNFPESLSSRLTRGQ